MITKLYRLSFRLKVGLFCFIYGVVFFSFLFISQGKYAIWVLYCFPLIISIFSLLLWHCKLLNRDDDGSFSFKERFNSKDEINSKAVSVGLAMLLISSIGSEGILISNLSKNSSLQELISNFLICIIVIVYFSGFVTFFYLIVCEMNDVYRFDYKSSVVDSDYSLFLWNWMAYQNRDNEANMNLEDANKVKLKTVWEMYIISKKGVTLQEEIEVLANLKKIEVDTLILIQHHINNKIIYLNNARLSISTTLKYLKGISHFSLGTSAVGFTVLKLWEKIDPATLKGFVEKFVNDDLFFGVITLIICTSLISLLAYHILIPVSRKKQVERVLPKILELAIKHKQSELDNK